MPTPPPAGCRVAALAGLASAAVQGRLALGPRAGARVERVDGDPDAPWVESARPLQARCDGYDLHADVMVPGEDRRRLEHLCRYLLRPPIAQERLTLRPDGTGVVTLKTPWRDGTTHLRFEPLTLLERLVTLTPRPWINVLLYHGILAPDAARRAAAVAYGRPPSGERSHAHAPGAAAATPPVPLLTGGAATPEPHAEPPGPMAPGVPGMPVAPPPGSAAPAPTAADRPPRDPAPGSLRPPRWRWADLLQRVFEIDVLVCPNCGGRMRVLTTIEDPRVVRRILTHLGLRGDAGPTPRPPAQRAA